MLALLAGVVVLTRLRRNLLAKGIVWLLRGRRGLRLVSRLPITSELIVPMVGLGTLVLHRLSTERV